MRHYLLTRSAYGPRVSMTANKSRLEILRRVTAPSIAAQTERDVTWLVMVDPADRLLDHRLAILASVGLPVITTPADGLNRSSRHDLPAGPWGREIDWSDAVLTSRIDDDDAFAPWALRVLREKAETVTERTAWVLTAGYRVACGRANLRRDPNSQFAALYAPRGDRATVMDVNHAALFRLAPSREASGEPSWLWLRHRATRSIRSSTTALYDRDRMSPIEAAVQSIFPVDWSFIKALP